MKRIVLILFISLIGFNAKAQDPRLFENTWYVHVVVIDSEEFFPTLTGRLIFDPEVISVGHDACEDYIGSFITYVNEDEFTLNDYWDELGLCGDPYYLNFMFKHYEIYFEEPPSPMNPFTYSIVSDGENKTLTITNGVGNYAVYGDEILPINDQIESSISIYPNPAKNLLTIDNTSNTEITSINLYDVLGRLVMTEKGNISEIDVSHLNSGLLFVEIKTDKGVITEKILKE